MPRLRRAVPVDSLSGLRPGVRASGVVRAADVHAAAAAEHGVKLLKLRAAVFCIVAAAFAALFIFITGRRALERDVTGTIYAAALSIGLTWMTVRTYRRFQRS